MWISKKKWLALEQRMADLEEKIQSQLEFKANIDTRTKDRRKVKQIVKDSLTDAFNRYQT